MVNKPDWGFGLFIIRNKLIEAFHILIHTIKSQETFQRMEQMEEFNKQKKIEQMRK